ncbi:hypothetical protein GTP46_03520 [Duganella sp. FT135W]|uniref:Uncharacterized protein n=1 Tax=Duganella flavida TaxID=2692175 RepID=A0A6L8K2H7_9BURK|nr:hypothetical protein [Duganella flavida]MYM21719.1 hypothetical protein [Duganella flavida]
MSKVGFRAILLDKRTEQTLGLLAYYHLVEKSARGVQYKIASEIAMWLFLLGPKSSGIATVFFVRRSRPVSLARQEILRCGKMPLLWKNDKNFAVLYEWFYTC